MFKSIPLNKSVSVVAFIFVYALFMPKNEMTKGHYKILILNKIFITCPTMYALRTWSRTERLSILNLRGKLHLSKNVCYFLPRAASLRRSFLRLVGVYIGNFSTRDNIVVACLKHHRTKKNFKKKMNKQSYSFIIL